MPFDDGSEVFITTPEEDPPKDGVWRDIEEEVIQRPTDDEVEAGAFLGEAINVDDDQDDGSQWGTPDNPALTAEDFEELA